jgi:hypothetical protein
MATICSVRKKVRLKPSMNGGQAGMLPHSDDPHWHQREPPISNPSVTL